MVSTVADWITGSAFLIMDFNNTGTLLSFIGLLSYLNSKKCDNTLGANTHNVLNVWKLLVSIFI